MASEELVGSKQTDAICDEAVKLTSESDGGNKLWQAAYHGAMLMRSAIQDGEVEPTQRGDEIAAKMRAYYDEHVGDPWKEGTADDLMLGLYNIAVRGAALKEQE